MSQENKQIIEKVNAAFANNDVDGFLALCTDDLVWRMVGEKDFKGKAAVREFMGSGPSEAPQFTVENIIAEGDTVAAFGDMTMKGKDGTPEAYSYCDVYKIRGDKVAELISYVVRTAASSAAA